MKKQDPEGYKERHFHAFIIHDHYTISSVHLVKEDIDIDKICFVFVLCGTEFEAQRPSGASGCSSEGWKKPQHAWAKARGIFSAVAMSLFL